MTRTTDPFIWRPDNTFNEFAHINDEQNVPLKGLKLAVKDLFHIKNIPTTAGNPDWLLTHVTPEKTNSTILRLIENGAELVGKTLTDELAYSLNGQNIHYGTPENPLTPDRLPGGSSSGSAVAVAKNEADIGLGTDTGGSIRVPASYNHLFGLRPTHGVIATEEMVGLAPGFDTVGWVTRDINTLASVAKTLLCGCDSPLSKSGVYFPKLHEYAEHKDDIESFLEAINLTLDTAVMPEQFLKNTSESFRILQGRQIWQEHGNWITNSKPRFAPDIQQRFSWCESLTEKDEDSARATADKINRYVDSLLSIYGVIILPTTPGPSPLLATPPEALAEYRNTLMSMTAIAGLGGLPQIHIPLKTKNNLAAGVSLIGKKHSDLSLVKLAASLTGVTL